MRGEQKRAIKANHGFHNFLVLEPKHANKMASNLSIIMTNSIIIKCNFNNRHPHASSFCFFLLRMFYSYCFCYFFNSVQFSFWLLVLLGIGMGTISAIVNTTDLITYLILVGLINWASEFQINICGKIKT